MNDKLKKLALNRKVESGSIGNTMHVVLLLCNGACNVNKGRIYKKKGGRSSTKRTGRLYPRRNPWYSFSEAESTSEHMVFSEGTTEKIPSDTTGDRSRGRPSSSAVP